MRPPAPRGPLGENLLATLRRSPGPAPHLRREAERALAATSDALEDDDVQHALLVALALHHRGIDGIDDRWEWSPDVVALLARLADAVEDRLRAAVRPWLPEPPEPGDLPATLFALSERDGPQLASYLARLATPQQFREFLIHRSLYHLGEADAHTWAIPRLAGAPKAALVEIQADEYGGGRPDRMHAALFATTMRAAGLDDTFGVHVDAVPAVTLAWANSFHVLGLQRRLRGATVGHLAALEMTSSGPNRRYAQAVRRLGFPAEAAWFYDEHVEADAVHEQIAAHDLAGRLAAAEPGLTGDILFGAAVALETDARVGAHLLESWEQGVTSLRGSDGTRRDARTAARADVA